MKVYSESMFASLLKILGGGKFRKALRDAEKITEEEPGLQTRLKQFSNDSEKLKIDMENFCKKYPHSPLCKGRGNSMVTDAEY